MLLRCFGCGAERNTEIFELYCYEEEGMDDGEPRPPLFVIPCDYTVSSSNPTLNDKSGAAVVCHECFHKLSPDMWIDRGCWESIDPLIQTEDLPDIFQGVQNCSHAARAQWDPETYAHVKVPIRR